MGINMRTEGSLMLGLFSRVLVAGSPRVYGIPSYGFLAWLTVSGVASFCGMAHSQVGGGGCSCNACTTAAPRGISCQVGCCRWKGLQLNRTVDYFDPQ